MSSLHLCWPRFILLSCHSLVMWKKSANVHLGKKIPKKGVVRVGVGVGG